MNQRIREALPEALRKDFDYLVTRTMNVEADLNYMEALWSGDWPGMEWIKDAKKANGWK